VLVLKMSTVPIPPSLEYTLHNVNSGTVKIKTIKLVELKDLCGYYHEFIQDLGKKLKEEKDRNSVATSVETSVKANKLRAELKEPKDKVVPLAVNPGDAGGQGQAEEDLPD
jgi:hypothetical protein